MTHPYLDEIESTLLLARFFYEFLVNFYSIIDFTIYDDL